MYAFIFFCLVIIVLLLRDSKHISPCDNISKQCLKQKFGVARKTTLYRNKKFGVRNKKFGVAQKVIWCRQKQVDVAQKSVSCHQKKV